MIEFTNTVVSGWEPAIRGMRNSMNSWDKSDTYFLDILSGTNDAYTINGKYKAVTDDIVGCGGDLHALGANDHELMLKLAKAGPSHSKYRRMINVTTDILAPLYWWKEFDTYKVGTVANSCSTMHKLTEKKFAKEDFSCERLNDRSMECLKNAINELNFWRDIFLNGGTMVEGHNATLYKPKAKSAWWQMIQLLPTSYNQKRTVALNYEVLSHLYFDRQGHRLDEWKNMREWIRDLPHSELITLEGPKVEDKTIEDGVKELMHLLHLD